MPRTFRPTFFVAVAAALLLAAGCTTTVTGTPAPTGGSSSSGGGSSAAPPTTTRTADAVGWVDDVCGALLDFTTAATVQPNIDTADPASALQGLSDYLGNAIAAVDKALTGLDAVGPSPVAGGDEVVRRLTSTLSTFKTSFENAKTEVDNADPNDPASLVALPDALAPLEQLANLPNPLADVQSSPELDRAAAQAPNCQKISG